MFNSFCPNSLFTTRAQYGQDQTKWVWFWEKGKTRRLLVGQGEKLDAWIRNGWIFIWETSGGIEAARKNSRIGAREMTFSG